MAQQRQICDRAVFDGSFDDPRTLVYFYQQKMRGELLAKIAAERNRPTVWSICLSSVANAFRRLAVAPVRIARPVGLTSAA